MTFDPNDRRLYKPDLARRKNRTPRTIDNWWASGRLPPPHRDECGRPFNWFSEIIAAEAALDRDEDAA